MSKNFELLQQIGNEEELFRAGCHSASAISAKNGNADPGLDPEAREKILQDASLPDVLETGCGTSSTTLGLCSEPSADLSQASQPAGLAKPASSDEFRNSRNPSSPIDGPAMRTQNRARRRGTKSDSLSSGLSSDWKSRVSFATTSHGSLPRAENETPRRSFQKSSSPLPWVDGIKTAANRWASKLNARNSRFKLDVDVLAREEEIKMVQRVFPSTNENSPRIALFAGLEGEAGSASICARAGEMLAARGEGPVCVVDANFRSPSLHRYFGLENEKGLVEATIEAGPIQNFLQQIPEPDLWLMPCGQAAINPRFAAMADGLRVRIAELRETFRYVVLHSGPLRLETTAMLLSRWTDGVVVVLEANSTRRDTARRAKENLAAAGVSILGVVLNNRTFPIPEAIYRRL